MEPILLKQPSPTSITPSAGVQPVVLAEREFKIPLAGKCLPRLPKVAEAVLEELKPGEVPIRFVVSQTGKKEAHCELGVVQGDHDALESHLPLDAIFHLKPRLLSNYEQFNAVVIIPTGVGAEIGGHAGDATPVIRLLGSICDRIITHPNAVNASDINEMPHNALYVEGSVLCRFLMGTIGLQPVRANRVLAVVEDHREPVFTEATVNAISAARSTLGLECPRVVIMKKPFHMAGQYSSTGRAVGRIEHFEHLMEAINAYRDECDAIALATLIDVPDDIYFAYWKGNVINPWGGVEAMLTHAVSLLTGLPSAHSPMMESSEKAEYRYGILDPRKAAEAVSLAFFHCVLKGLHTSPRIIPLGDGPAPAHLLTAADVSCVVIPDGCVGLPTLAALEQGIPVIAVQGNRNEMRNRLEDYPFRPENLLFAKNYFEALGIMAALKAGVAPAAIGRPMSKTKVTYLAA